MDLTGRVALVTGGGTGIGRAVCLRLAKAGAKAVVVNYSRSDKEAQATAAELIVLGPEVIAHPDLDALTDDVWDDVFKVNLKGTFYCCREAAPELRKTGGAIVNIASIAGHRATGSSIVYAVSKAAVLQLTRALAVALAPEVRVNSVSPGLVSTRWFRQFDARAAALQESSASATTPLQVIAAPDHVAQAVMAFVENDMLTGQDVVVDGGKNILY